MTGKERIKRILATSALAFALIFAALPQAGFAVGTGGSGEDRIDARVEELLSEMTVKEKVAQMMMVAMPASGAASIQEKYQFGGYLLFGRDFARTNAGGMKRLLKSCQNASEIPMLTAVDEEGGTVVRASLYSWYRSGKFRSPRQVYRSGGYTEIVRDTKKKDRFLKSLGLNTNLAPVADVPYGSYDFIYDRGFSVSANGTSKFIRLTVTQMGKDRVISTLKHFPGYGGNGDTHGRIIRDTRPLSTFESRDLKPFRSGIKAGTDMIMVSHVKVNAFDSRRPASLSKKVHTYLRKELGFDGVIITDGLGMKGVTDFAGDQGAAAVKAVQAGNDMLCVTGSYTTCYNALIAAVRKGTITKDRLDKSVRRILKMKIKRGLIK